MNRNHWKPPLLLAGCIAVGLAIGCVENATQAGGTEPADVLADFLTSFLRQLLAAFLL